MQTTIASRTPLLAAAAVTAAAISAAAVAPAPQVALTGFDSPISQFLDTLSFVNNDIWNGYDTFGDFQWEPYQGLVPETIYTALPIFSQTGYNGSGYFGALGDAAINSLYTLSEAAWNLPPALVTAAQQAASGNIQGAINTLTNATIVPLQTAATITVNTLLAIAQTVVANAAAVAAVIPGIVQGLATTVTGGVQAVINAAISIATQTIGAISTGDVQTAWNTVVDGLLGPVGADGTVESSIAGVLENMTIGPGLGPLGNPNGYAVPSLRMWGEQSQLQIANAIGSNYPVPAAATKRTAKRVAAKVAAKPAAVKQEKRRRG